MTIDFYYYPASGPCRSVHLIAKLLGVELNLKHIDLFTKEQLSPEFVKINPQHTVPTLVDNGFVLWESYAILTYLAEQYGKENTLYPKDAKKKAVVNQRLFFDMGTLSKAFAEYYYPIFMAQAVPDPEKFTKIEDAFKLLEIFLSEDKFVAGHYLTVADIALATTVSTYDAAKFDFTPYKNVSNWFEMVKTVLPDFETISGKEVLQKMTEKFVKK